MSEEASGVRLDVYLATHLPELSRSQLKKMISEGLALVDGSAVKAGLTLRTGMTLEVELASPKAPALKAQEIPLDIVYEDSWVIVINKAPGMVVHPAAGNADGTLVNALLAHCDDLSGIGGELRPGIVHRLDKETSGLLVAAKNDHAHRALSAQLATHEMGREYLAVTVGKMPDDQGSIDAALGRSKRDRTKMAIDPTGRRAITHYQVLKRVAGLNVVRCRLETGRTHQIRVHLAHRNWPVAGDPVYGPKRKTLLASIPHLYSRLRPAMGAIQRQLLHAERLTFAHPDTGKEQTFTAPPPEDMASILRLLDELAE